MIAVDSSTPGPNTGATSGSALSSNNFSPPANSLIAAVVAVPSQALATTSVNDNLGAHLTWTRQAVETANGCSVEVWVAYTASSQSNMHVTATFASNPSGQVTVGAIVFTGAASSQGTAGTSVATSASGTPNTSLAVSPGSQVVMVTANATNQASLVNYNHVPYVINGQNYRTTPTTVSTWTQVLYSPVGSSSTTVSPIGAASPGSIAYSMVAVEILMSSGPPVMASFLSHVRPASGQLWPRGDAPV